MPKITKKPAKNPFIEGYKEKMRLGMIPPPPRPTLWLRFVALWRRFVGAFNQKVGSRPKKVPKPEIDRKWTILYYGPRGSGKTLHQAKLVRHILRYLDWLYFKFPQLKPAIVFSVQKFSPELEKKYLGKRLFYWSDAKDLAECPRKNCWKGKQRHRLHGAYVVFDDMATILPADNWTQTPVWLRKMFAQARHFGIRIIANCQDPFSVDVNFRRYVDLAFRFRKLMGSRDPDETKPPVKMIWGVYQRRKIKAEDLWKYGDMSDDEILMLKEKNKQIAELTGTPVSDIWAGTYHLITRDICEIYDTTQDVPEYRPRGYMAHTLACIDPAHDHENPEAPNYCKYKKTTYELV